MKREWSFRFLLAMSLIALLGSCSKPAATSDADGTNAAQKQAWVTPLSPAVEDALRDRVWQAETGT